MLSKTPETAYWTPSRSHVGRRHMESDETHLCLMTFLSVKMKVLLKLILENYLNKWSSIQQTGRSYYNSLRMATSM